MPFLPFERAGSHGPVELYTFRQGVDTLFTTPQVWRYAASDSRRVLLGVNAYEPLAIARGRRQSGDEDQGRGLEVRVPLASPVAQLYVPRDPPHPLKVEVHRYHRGDRELARLFRGQVARCRFEGNHAVFTCEPLSHALEGAFPRLTEQRLCPFTVYDTLCGVDAAAERVRDHGIQTVLTVSADKRVITTAEAALVPAGELTGAVIFHMAEGSVVSPTSLGFRKTLVVRHTVAPDPDTGDPVGTLELLVPDPALAPGHVIETYRGCDGTTGPAGCGRFNNIGRYGGNPYMPVKNPITDGVL